MPTVSINLCCYNSEKYLEETLQSIFAQTYSDWELVVVNDGSTDSTERIAQRHLGEGRNIVYHAQANAGLGAARNKALELSQGEFIALIDHDDLWHPTKLEKQLALFTRPEVALIYSGAAAWIMGREPTLVVVKRPMYRGNVFIPIVLENFVPCASMVIRRIALEKVGAFDPRLNQVEEYDLAIRLAESYEFDYTEEPLLTFRVHPRNASWDRYGLQSEMIALMDRVLARSTFLSRELGPAVTRIRRVGLPCEPGHAYLLRSRFRTALAWYGSVGRLLKAIPRLVAICMLAVLPPKTVARVIHWRYQLRKLRLLREEG